MGAFDDQGMGAAIAVVFLRRSKADINHESSEQSLQPLAGEWELVRRRNRLHA